MSATAQDHYEFAADAISAALYDAISHGASAERTANLIAAGALLGVEQDRLQAAADMLPDVEPAREPRAALAGRLLRRSPGVLFGVGVGLAILGVGVIGRRLSDLLAFGNGIYQFAATVAIDLLLLLAAVALAKAVRR